MKSRRLCLIWVLVCSSALVFARPVIAECKGCAESDKLCGPNCLLIVCNKLSIPADINELTKLTGYNEKNGTTMAGLQAAAKTKGLKSAGMKIGLDELATLKVPIIAYLWDNHFVVVERASDGAFIIIDPPMDPVSVKKEDLAKVYSGFALLVSKDSSAFPKSETKGPDLRIDSYTWDFGSVDEGSFPIHIFKCKNVGDSDLVISKADASCSCITPLVSRDVIPAGGECEVKIIYDTKGQTKDQAKKVLITSNDPISPVVQLGITGYVKLPALAASPSIIDFGELPVKSEMHQFVYVPSTKEEPVEVLSASSESAFLTASVSKSTEKDKPGYMIDVAMKPGAPLGNFGSKVTIVSNHPKQPKTEIPVVATIVGDITVDYKSLFLGVIRKGTEARATITVTTTSDEPFSITGVESSLSYLSLQLTPKTENKEYYVVGTLTAKAPAGNITGDIIIRTNNTIQPEIKVPVYAYVEE